VSASKKTQRDQAKLAFYKIQSPTKAADILGEVLDRAQNRPPLGEADGTIDEATFNALRAVEVAARRLGTLVERAHHALSVDSKLLTSILGWE
jgi:hypothetical protein